MFDIQHTANGNVSLHGRFDAAQVEAAARVLNQIDGSCVIDFDDLSYISSAGLGLLFATQRRLVDGGATLTLINLNAHIREIFDIAGFDQIFEMG